MAFIPSQLPLLSIPDYSVLQNQDVILCARVCVCCISRPQFLALPSTFAMDSSSWTSCCKKWTAAAVVVVDDVVRLSVVVMMSLVPFLWRMIFNSIERLIGIAYVYLPTSIEPAWIGSSIKCYVWTHRPLIACTIELSINVKKKKVRVSFLIIDKGWIYFLRGSRTARAG